jgi:uncharacterized protein YidB (DUF937 family)
MARSTPSLLALLGFAALAGYQNRDKLGDLMGQQQRSGAGSGSGAPSGSASGGGLDSLLSGLGGAGGGLGGLASGGGIAAGLRDLIEGFSTSGRRETAESWVSTGANRTVSTEELESSLGPELLDDLSHRTGLDRQELLRRLAENLPDTVDGLTPDGRVPDA